MAIRARKSEAEKFRDAKDSIDEFFDLSEKLNHKLKRALIKIPWADSARFNGILDGHLFGIEITKQELFKILNS